jgi:hypothetical protein
VDTGDVLAFVAGLIFPELLAILLTAIEGSTDPASRLVYRASAGAHRGWPFWPR